MGPDLIIAMRGFVQSRHELGIRHGQVLDSPHHDSVSTNNEAAGNKMMAKPVLWVVAIPAVALAYYFGIARPANDETRLTLEQQKYVDEQRRDGLKLTERTRPPLNVTNLWMHVSRQRRTIIGIT